MHRCTDADVQTMQSTLSTFYFLLLAARSKLSKLLQTALLPDCQLQAASLLSVSPGVDVRHVTRMSRVLTRGHDG